MLCINCSNQPPKWLHPSRPVIPFDQVAKQISILFALAMMIPILFMNDLLVPPVQDMLVLPFTFPGVFVPAKGVPWVFGAAWNLHWVLLPVLPWKAALAVWWQEFASWLLSHSSSFQFWLLYLDKTPFCRKAHRIQGELCLCKEVTAKGCRGDSGADHLGWCLQKHLGGKQEVPPGVFVTSPELSHSTCRAQCLQECPVGLAPSHGQSWLGCSRTPSVPGELVGGGVQSWSYWKFPSILHFRYSQRTSAGTILVLGLLQLLPFFSLFWR